MLKKRAANNATNEIHGADKVGKVIPCLAGNPVDIGRTRSLMTNSSRNEIGRPASLQAGFMSFVSFVVSPL